MIKNIIISTCNIIKTLFKKFRKTKEEKTEQQSNKQENTIVVKDRLLFQPNTIQTNSPLECPIRPKKPQASTEIPINDPKIENFTITLECNETAINHLNNLCRFFEVTQPDALTRGVWLLTIARDVEISNKKLGVITTDSNGFIIDIMPINIV